MLAQAAEFAGQVGTQLWLRLLHFGYELFTTVDQGDHVAEVAAAQEALTATIVERLDLRRQQIGR